MKKEETSVQMKWSEVSVQLDTYEDIFSDFDPRPYQVRAVSDDLLTELRHANTSKPSGELELRFIIPRSQRNVDTEVIVERRLREHFKKHYLELHREVKQVRQKGYLFVGIGAVLTLLAALLSYSNEGNFLFYVLTTLLEPAGWFTIWNGFDLIVFGTHHKDAELKFYERMSNAEISFIGY